MRSEWLRAADVRERLLAAGLGESELLRVLAYGGQRFGLKATEFWIIHNGDETRRSSEREVVSSRLWRVFERVGPEFDLVDDVAKERFQTTVSWDSGTFAWTLGKEYGTCVQETWSSVYLDVLSAGSLIEAVSTRSHAQILQDHQIDEWIRDKCPTENSREAWTLYQQEHGKRSGKREHHFKPVSVFRDCQRHLSLLYGIRSHSRTGPINSGLTSDAHSAKRLLGLSSRHASSMPAKSVQQ